MMEKEEFYIFILPIKKVKDETGLFFIPDDFNLFVVHRKQLTRFKRRVSDYLATYYSARIQIDPYSSLSLSEARIAISIRSFKNFIIKMFHSKHRNYLSVKEFIDFVRTQKQQFLHASSEQLEQFFDRIWDNRIKREKKEYIKILNATFDLLENIINNLPKYTEEALKKADFKFNKAEYEWYPKYEVEESYDDPLRSYDLKVTEYGFSLPDHEVQEFEWGYVVLWGKNFSTRNRVWVVVEGDEKYIVLRAEARTLFWLATELPQDVILLYDYIILASKVVYSSLSSREKEKMQKLFPELINALALFD